jgi:calcineurin-like phosphoesterase family protein
MREQLNGKIILIKGNHDEKNLTQTGAQELFEFVTYQMKIQIEGRKIYLNHYPFLCYAGTYRDANGLEYQAFGHVHSGPGARGLDVDRLSMLFPTQYDVGVDNNNYEPISWSELNDKIGQQLLKTKFKVK